VRTERFRRRVERGERGVALVEFALVFPVFMTLVLGMFYGGLAYNRKITMTNAAREAARYGATLNPAGLPFLPDPAGAPGSSHGLDTWLYRVADVVQQNAEDDLNTGTDGLRICVGFVHPAGGNHGAPGNPNNDKVSHTLIRDNSGSTFGASGPAAQCFADGGQGADKRVQIEVRRRSNIELLFFAVPVTITERAIVRFEATTAP
jgi:hypothetical protein